MSNESKFVTAYGPKKQGANAFNPKMDTTDQRAVIMTPQDAFQQFLRPDAELMDELESETIDDFDNDIYEYEDRGELGEDILLSQDPDIAKVAPQSKKQLQRR